MKTQTSFLTIALMTATLFTANAKTNKLANSALKSKPILSQIDLNSNETGFEKLTIEKWMTDSYYWGMTEDLLSVTTKGEEPKLTIEDWMVSDYYWRAKPYELVMETDHSTQQKALAIEKWMTDDSYWR